MIDISEHNPMDLTYNEDMEDWYQYIASGIIYNMYDVSVFRHSDSDYD